MNKTTTPGVFCQKNDRVVKILLLRQYCFLIKNVLSIFKVCRVWKFCPYTNKEPTLEQLKYLEYIHKLEILVDLRLSVLEKRINDEANQLVSDDEKEFKMKLIKDNEKKEKEKYFNDIVYLFYPRFF